MIQNFFKSFFRITLISIIVSNYVKSETGILTSYTPITIENENENSTSNHNTNAPGRMSISTSTTKSHDYDVDDEKCGTCEIVRLNTTQAGSNKNRSESPDQSINFRESPHNCKCDSDCVIYGDCCLKIAIDNYHPDLSIKNKWKCHKILNNHKIWAFMISDCPAEMKNLPIYKKCHLVDQLQDKDWTYDLPVYSNKTQFLYRNIFCALCNKVKKSDIFLWTKRFSCSENGNGNNSSELEDPIKRAEFFKTSLYYPKQFIWTNINQNIKCELTIVELSNHSSIEKSIPNIRYCSESIDTCPENYSDVKTEQFCNLYSNYVQGGTFFKPKIYKNLHCAMCHGVQQELKCYEPNSLLITRYGIGASSNIGYLFDFSLDEDDDGGVGFESICEETEIWDFIRKKCHPIICGRGYVINDDEECVRIKNYRSMDNITSNLDDCFRLFLSEGEFEKYLTDNMTYIIRINSTQKGEYHIYTENEIEYINDTTISICAKNLHEGFQLKFTDNLNLISTISMSISVFCLGAHILIFCSFKFLRNLPGNNLFCLVLSLFISQLLFVSLINHQNTHLCISVAIIVHFFFLASFLWMFIMSVDIFRTFSKTRKRSSSKSRKITFIKYSLFAWGISFCIVALACSLEFFLPPKNDHDNDDDEEINKFINFLQDIRPNYGKSSCWISSRLSLFVFFGAPVFILIFTNLMLFLLTTRAIFLQKRETSRVLKIKDSNNSTSNRDELRMKLYVKLWVILGLSYILGFLSAALDLEFLWYPFVILNGLQGLQIFISFDFKKKIIRLILNKCPGPCKNIIREEITTETGATTNNFSTANTSN